MEQLYEKYLNVQKFAKYRNYSIDNQKYLEYDDFKNKIQQYGYIQHKFIDKSFNEKVDIYLFSADSKYIRATSEFIKLLDRYREYTHIITITKEKLNTYISKAIKKYTNIVIDNFLHKHFIIEISKGPLCSKHSILSTEETKNVCLSLMTHGHKLPAISVDDPQVIWIGGRINDVIKIEANSEITGKTIRYRIVTPLFGKTEQSDILKIIDVNEKEGGDEKINDDRPDNDNLELNEITEEEYYEDYE